MDAKLVVVSGDAKPSEIRLVLPAIIGRGRQATLILPHPLVSRSHCELTECDGQLVVRDLESLNGTYVNQRRIRQAVVPPGGLLTLGAVTFRAVYACEQAEGLAAGPQQCGTLPESSGLDRPGSLDEPIREMTEFVLDENTPASSSAATSDTEPAVDEILQPGTVDAEGEAELASELADLLRATK